MAQYIDKDALVAEIEKIRAKWFGVNNDFADGQKGALTDVLSLINTLQVKEVDLQKYYHEFLQKEWFGNSHVRTVSEMMAFTAKHFFELGLRSTITEEDCKLIWTIGDDIPYMSEEDFYKELLKRYKAQKGDGYNARQSTENP